MLAGLLDRWVESSLERQLEPAVARLQAIGLPLRLVLWDGRSFECGRGARIALKLNSPMALRDFITPSLGTLGEAFVEGRIDVQGPIHEVIAVADSIADAHGASAAARAALKLAEHQRGKDAAAISYHYDVSNAFYKLWLDERMVYSCAYFKNGSEDIHLAQQQKLDHICRKLQLRAGERLLDIGCGWGGLVIHAARHYGVHAHGITLSKAQHEEACVRVAAAGLQERVKIELRDYRDLTGDGVYDKISSVGMFEHVGLKNLPQYFAIIRRLLKERGLALNHGITSMDVNNRAVGGGGGDFIEKYVFPGGELPHIALVMREMSAQMLEIADVESLRIHYAKTLSHWSGALESKLAAAQQLVPEKTLRIWRAYLAGCAYAFEQGWINLYQVLASKQTKPGPTALPLTREYIYR
ncbi:MAG: class I SAM-dependent methyltransferase [Burkholderiaceae bacterium]